MSGVKKEHASMRFSGIQMLRLLAIIVFNSISVFSMDTQLNAQKLGREMSRLLPGLTVVTPSTSSGQLSMVLHNDQKKQQEYVRALSLHDPIAALQKVAQPIPLGKHEQLIESSWVERGGSQKFLLADFALAVKQLEEFGNVVQTERALLDIEHKISPYLSWQEPILYSVRCVRQLLANQPQESFNNLLLLEDKAKTFSCWQPMAQLLTARLVDGNCLPACKRLADRGDREAQVSVIRVIVTEALKNKSGCLELAQLAPYAESLLQEPKYQEIGNCLVTFCAYLHAYQAQCYDTASSLLLALLQEQPQEALIPELYHLSREQLAMLAQLGDIRANCFVAMELLSSSNKNKKAEGLAIAEPLVRSCMEQKDALLERKLQDFGLLNGLQKLAVDNHPGTCAFWAEWQLYKVLNQKPDPAAEKALYKKIKRYASSGFSGKPTHAGDLQQVDIFVKAVLQFYSNDPNAVFFLIDFITMSDHNFHLNSQMCMRAEELLEQLAEKGQLDACCYKIHRLLHREKEKISDATLAFGIKTAELYLAERMPSQSDDSCVRIRVALSDCIARATEAQANSVGSLKFLLSKLQFLLLHEGCQETGLVVETDKILQDIFFLANAAHKAGVQEATPFVQALAAYSGARTHMSQKRTKEGVEQLLKLLAVEFSPSCKQVCVNFARHQLVRAAQAGDSIAGAWHVADLLTSTKEDDIDKGLSVCERLATGFLGKQTGSLEWQQALEPFKRLKIVETIEKNRSKDVWKNKQYDAAYILAQWYLLQVVVPYIFLEESLAHDEIKVLEKALEYAKIAWGKQDSESRSKCADLMGAIYHVFGQMYLKHDDLEKAGQMLAEGSRLNHPASIRACAMLALETPNPESPRMPEALFNAQIAMVERAYQLGDKKAGAILAQHYFDGQLSPFACGNYVEKNIDKALKLAQDIGGEYPQTARILGFLKFYEALTLYETKKVKKDLAPAVELLIAAALGGQMHAYGHIEELLLCPLVTDSVAQRAHLFITEQADKYIPEALCALAGIFLASSDTKHIGDAVSCYEQAAQYSEGRLGHFELTHFYLRHTVDGKRDILKAASHCLAMTEAGVRARCAPVEHGQVTAQVLGALLAYEGTEAERKQATALHQQIRDRLSQVGVAIQEAGSEQVGHTQPASIVQAVSDAMQKEEDLQAQMHAKAKSGDPEAHYFLSGYFLEKACRVFGAQQVQVGSTQDFIAAIEHATQAFRKNPNNVTYKNQLITTHNEWFRYYQEVLIPHLAHDQDQYAAALLGIEKTVAALNKSGLHADDILISGTLALTCIRDLAARGSVRALELVLTNELNSENAEQQQIALQAMYKGCFVLSRIDEDAWQSLEVANVLKPHKATLEKLAVDGNGYASFIMGCATFKEIETSREKKDIINLIPRALKYFVSALKQGCKEAETIVQLIQVTYNKEITHDTAKKLIAALEEYALSHPVACYPDLEAVHFITRIYREGKIFPCGVTIVKNNVRAYEFALRWKDVSATSLMNVCFIAQESRDYPRFFEHAFELFQEGAFTLNDMVQFAVQFKLFPHYFREYLFEEAKRGDAHALRSLSVLLQQSNELPIFVSLCQALYQEGNPQACTELALVYMDPLFEGKDIQTALRYADEYITKIKGSKEAVAEFINSIFKRLTFTVSFEAATAHESPVKQQVCDAIIALEKQVKEICGTKFMSAELKGAQVVLLCATNAADFVKIIDTFADLLAIYKKHTPEQFEETLKCCALMIVRAYKGVMAYEGKDKAALTKMATTQMVRLNDLISKLDPNSKALLQSIVKKK